MMGVSSAEKRKGDPKMQFYAIDDKMRSVKSERLQADLPRHRRATWAKGGSTLLKSETPCTATSIWSDLQFLWRQLPSLDQAVRAMTLVVEEEYAIIFIQDI
jgi:hypothetical protein